MRMLFDCLPLAITVAICLLARPIGEALCVLDCPDEVRKSHARPTPMVGGIAVVASLVIWSAGKIVWGPGGEADFHLAILLCGGGVAVLGFMDDQGGISAGGRLLLIAIFSVIALHLDPLLTPDRLHLEAGIWMAAPPLLMSAVTVLALAGFSSAVNMADGLNGMVLAFVCIWSLCLAFVGGTEVAAAAAVIGSASLLALMFNFRGRLFLGNCGAFTLAFVIGLLAVRSHDSGHLLLETALVWFYLPVLDCLRMITVRLWHGRSPFTPDREHFHHRLAARFGERWAIAIYAGLVGSTSLLATLVPQLAVFGLMMATAVFGGFLFADSLAARGSIAGSSLPLSTTAFALDKKLVKGP